MSRYNYDGSDQFRPISAWGYVGYSILFSIPILGIILLFVFAFSGRNINRRSFARSYFCWFLIVLIIVILSVTGVLSGILGKSLMERFPNLQATVENYTGKLFSNTKKAAETQLNKGSASASHNTEPERSIPTEPTEITNPEPTKAITSDSKNTRLSTDEMVTVQVGGKTLEIRQTFKKAMDEYEAFFDEYINVMESQDVIKMSNYVIKYAQTLEAFENMEDDLTDAEAVYYSHVSMRISQKLATVK